LKEMSVPPSYVAHEPVKVRFGHLLNRARTSRGATQMQLSQRSGLDRSFISDMERGLMERGLKEPTITAIECLMPASGVHPSELLADL
jgi:transcriptional regulator with XRE-family HTH domain